MSKVSIMVLLGSYLTGTETFTYIKCGLNHISTVIICIRKLIYVS